MAKILLLSAKETQALKTNGSVVVTRGGLSYLVDIDLNINPAKYRGQVVNPVDFGNDRLVLTIKEGQELAKTGRTTHQHGGVLFDIIRDEVSMEISAYPSVDNYSSVLTKDMY